MPWRWDETVEKATPTSTQDDFACSEEKRY